MLFPDPDPCPSLVGIFSVRNPENTARHETLCGQMLDQAVAQMAHTCPCRWFWDSPKGLLGKN